MSSTTGGSRWFDLTPEQQDDILVQLEVIINLDASPERRNKAKRLHERLAPKVSKNYPGSTTGNSYRVAGNGASRTSGKGQSW